MSYEDSLAKLNRLRAQAKQRPLKAWNGSQEQLDAQIKRLEDEGYEDKPPIDFGADAKADTPPTAEEIPALQGDRDIFKEMGDIAAAGKSKEADKPVTKVAAKLARGTDTESHCKKAVADARREERKDKKPKKAKIKDNKDGSATKTTTSGKKRKLGKELNDQIKEQRKNKGKSLDGDNFTVADLARELGMDAKVARAKLRRHEDEIKQLHSKGQDRWVFPNAAKKTISAILNPKRS